VKPKDILSIRFGAGYKKRKTTGNDDESSEDEEGGELTTHLL
jgi:hypothetical protein